MVYCITWYNLELQAIFTMHTSTWYKQHMKGTGTVCNLGKARSHKLLGLGRSVTHHCWPVSIPQSSQGLCQHIYTLLVVLHSNLHLGIHCIGVSNFGDSSAWLEPWWLLLPVLLCKWHKEHHHQRQHFCRWIDTWHHTNRQHN